MENHKIRSLFFTILCAACCLLMASTIYAAEYSVVVNVPVSVISQSGVPADTAVDFTLSPTDGAPVPEEASLSLKSSQSGTLGKITFTKPGKWIYRLKAVSQKPSQAVIEGVSDFRIVITVFNGDQGLESVITASDWSKPADQEPKEPIVIGLKAVVPKNPASVSGKPNTASENHFWTQLAYLSLGALLMAGILKICLHQRRDGSDGR